MAVKAKLKVIEQIENSKAGPDYKDRGQSKMHMFA